MLLFLSHLTAVIKYLLFLPNRIDHVLLVGGKTLLKRSFKHPLIFDLAALTTMVAAATIVFKERPTPLGIPLYSLIFLSYVYTSITAQNNTFRRAQSPLFQRICITFAHLHFPYWVFPTLVFSYSSAHEFWPKVVYIDELPVSVIGIVTWYSFIATISIYSYMVSLFSSYFEAAARALNDETAIIAAYQNNTLHYMGEELRDILRTSSLFSIKNILLHWIVFVFFLLNLSIALSLITYFFGVPFSQSPSFSSGFFLVLLNVLEAIMGFSFQEISVLGTSWIDDIFILRTVLVLLCIGFPVACLVDLGFTHIKLNSIVNRYWEKSN